MPLSLNEIRDRARAFARECDRVRLLLERAGGVDHQVDVQRGQGLVEAGGVAVDRDGAGPPVQRVRESSGPRGVATGHQQVDVHVGRERTADAGAEVAVSTQYERPHPSPLPPGDGRKLSSPRSTSCTSSRCRRGRQRSAPARHRAGSACAASAPPPGGG